VSKAIFTPRMKYLETLMDQQALSLAINRICHQILERNRDLSNVAIVGMQTRGVFLANRLAENIGKLSGNNLSVGVLDATLYRDDYRTPFKQPRVKVTDIPFDINAMRIVLVDDVLYTGRTVRAALDALTDFGRPQIIQLAVLVDRGHRELPIRADFVGMKMTTQPNQVVKFSVQELDGKDELALMELEPGE